jgi:hypothetical protein
MWQPTRAQQAVIWAVALFIVFTWPPREGGSLAVKAVRWAADPGNALPSLPEPLPMGLGDDGDAVAEHDRRMQEYYDFVEGSATNRLRLRLKYAQEPLDPGTERQLLAALAIVSALAVWQMIGKRCGPADAGPSPAGRTTLTCRQDDPHLPARREGPASAGPPLHGFSVIFCTRQFWASPV